MLEYFNINIYTIYAKLDYLLYNKVCIIQCDNKLECCIIIVIQFTVNMSIYAKLDYLFYKYGVIS